MDRTVRRLIRSTLRLGLAPYRFGGLALAFIVGFVVACSPGGAGAGGPGDPTALRVVASTTVLADLVRQVGGDEVTVESLVPPGGVVETFDPTPSDLARLANADLIVMNGLGLDDWLVSVIEDSGTSAPVLRLAEELPGVEYLVSEHDPGEVGRSGGEVNPHLWLDVSYAIRYVERIRDELARVDPGRSAGYTEAARGYIGRLRDLDAWARTHIATVPPSDRRIVSFHEAFPYFARAYGLEIVGTVVDAPGQDPSAGEIAALVDAIRSSGARAVFSEAQFGPELVDTVAREAGVVVESDLYNDSLGDPPVDTYEGLIRWDVDKVVAALTR